MGALRATNAIDIVERAYDISTTEADWLRGVIDAAFRDLDTGHGVYGFTDAPALPELAPDTAFAQRGIDEGVAQRIEALGRATPEGYHAVMRRCQVACGGLEETFGADHAIVRGFRAHMEPVGVRDGFSLFAQDGLSGGVSLESPSHDAVLMAPRVRSIWRRVGIHLANALRLRRRLAAQLATREAVFDPAQGKVEDLGIRLKSDRAAYDAIVAAARAMDRARTQAARSSPDDALSLWRGLVSGRWSLVEHWERDGRRFLFAFRNQPGAVDPRALTRTEASVLHYVGLGAPNKEIAFTLGLSLGTVSGALTQLLRKLRCESRVDLAHFADPTRLERVDAELLEGDVGVLSVDVRPSGPAMVTLSAAEREIAGYVSRGYSNERIARARGAAVRTVANQLQSIYAKLGVSSRSELRAALRSA